MNRVIGVKAIAPATLQLTFADGQHAAIDISAVFQGEAFEPLKDPSFFAEAEVDPDFGGVYWPNGADLSPEYLEAAAAAVLSRRR